MNKHVRTLILRIWLALFAFSLLAPISQVGAATDPGGGGGGGTDYIAIPLKKYTRDKPVVKNDVACNPGELIPVKGCIEIVSGTGVYNFVGAFSTYNTDNIGDLTVADLSTDYPGSSGSTTVDGTTYRVINNTIRVYGLTVGKTYSFYFNFYDAKSSDIDSLLTATKTECDAHPLPVGVGVINDTGHSTTNEKAQQIRQISQPDYGCQIYSDTPFLPAPITVSVNNGGAGYKYTRKGMTLSDTVDINAAATAAADDAAAGGGKATDANACSDSPFSWLACPLSKSLASFVQFIGGKIGDLLFTATDTIFTDEMRTSWNVFRNVGLALILIAGLVMVISQAMGLDILDAYTIRKLMPRLAIAVIGIALSWPLLRVAITLVNDLGLIAYDAIIYPFRDMLGIDGLSGTKQWTIFGSAGGAALIVGLFAGLDIIGVILFMFTIVLAVLIGWVVLAIRQIVIIMGILLAPLAIAAYVLPGTQKLWSFWKGTMITTLAMFPIIMAFLAAGDAAARVALEGGGNTLVAVMLFFAPYFMLPFAFKLAGGLMTTIFSIANDRNRGLFDRLSKARQGRSADMRNRIKEGRRWQGNAIGERLSRTAQTSYLVGSGQAGIMPQHLRSRTRAARSRLNTSLNERAMENDSVKIVAGDDDLAEAALYGNRTEASAREFLRDTMGQSGETLERNVAHIREARRAVGKNALEELLPGAVAGTGTGFGAGGFAQMMERIDQVAGTDTGKRARMIKAARAQAERAKRTDLYGPSYGDSVDIATAMNQNVAAAMQQRTSRLVSEGRTQQEAEADTAEFFHGVDPAARLSNDQANQLAGRSTLKHKSLYEVANSHYFSLEHLEQPLLERVSEAQVALDTARTAGGGAPTQEQQAAIDEAQHDYVRVMAQTETLLQGAAGVSERNNTAIGGMMGQRMSEDGPTLREAIATAKRDPTWEQYKYEYNSRYERGAAEAAAAAASLGVQAGQPPPPNFPAR